MTAKQKIMPLISIAIFLASLTQTTLVYKGYNGTNSFSAVSMLLMGTIAILGGGILEWFIWLANPFYLLSIYYFYRKNAVKSSGYSLISTLLAMLFLSWKQIVISESGSMGNILFLKTGYYLWLISIVMMAAISFYYYLQEQKQIRPTN